MAKIKGDNPDIPDKPNAIAGWCVIGLLTKKYTPIWAFSSNGKSDIIDFLA